MKTLSRTPALIGATLALSLFAGCSGGSSDQAAAVDDTPEGAAFQYRQGVMRAIAYKVGQLRGMTQGDIPVDDAAFTKNAADLATLAGMAIEGFIPNSAVAGSAAQPAIWTDWADFQQKGMDLHAAATALAEAAQSGGYQAGQGLVQGVGQTCGACHRPYRRQQGG